MPQTLFFMYKVYVASSDSELLLNKESFTSGAPLGHAIIPSKGPGLHYITEDSAGMHKHARTHTHAHTHTLIYASRKHINIPAQLVTTWIIKQITETCVT
jgi:hypothetical protein